MNPTLDNTPMTPMTAETAEANEVLTKYAAALDEISKLNHEVAKLRGLFKESMGLLITPKRPALELLAEYKKLYPDEN